MTHAENDAHIEGIIAGVNAGHRMASHEPDDFDRDLARRQLRGEVTAEEAVALAVAKVRSGAHIEGVIAD